MKNSKIGRLNLVLALILIAVGCASSSSKAPKVVTSSPSSNGFKLRPFKDFTLSNGLKVTLIEDRSLPYIAIGMLIKVGHTSDPQGLSGLANTVAELLDKGTRKHSATELADAMAVYGADFDASVSNDFASINASSLSFHEDKLLGHFSEIVTEPSFTNNEIARLKKQTIAGIQQMVDDPNEMADIAFSEYIFPNHPYGTPIHGKLKDVKAIQKKHITKYYLQYYRPSNAMLAVVGNYSADIEKKLEAQFGGWTDRAIKTPELSEFPAIKGLQLQVVDKGDLQQAQIRFGNKGIKRNDPDFVKLRLANAILGGGFSSRLMAEIRVKRGLTYNVGSFFDARLAEGPFAIDTFTRPEKIGESVKEILKVVSLFRSQGATDAEMKEAKAYLKGQFPRSLETAQGLSSNLLALRFYGVPDSYLTTYLNTVESISLADLNRTIKKYFDATNMKILIYAPKAKALPQLKDVGEIAVKSYREVL